MIALRLLHIVGGVLWVGSAVLLAWLLLPAIGAAGAGGGSVMGELMGRRRLPALMGVAGGLTLLSGLAMYTRFMLATDGAWAATRPGTGYTIGAAAALLAIVLGAGIGAPAGRRMAQLGAEMAREGGRPGAEQVAEMARLQRRAGSAGRIASVLLLIATAAMATARYW